MGRLVTSSPQHTLLSSSGVHAEAHGSSKMMGR